MSKSIMMNSIRAFLISILSMATCAISFAQEMPPAVVVIAAAELRTLAPSVDVPGTVVSRYDARLASELSAKLAWIAEVGTAVKFLRSEKNRLEKLAAKNLSAKSQLDRIISDLAIAEADEEIARVRLGLAQISMHITKIRAPFDGIVTERLRSIGERLNIADEVIRLVDPNSLEVVARAPLNTVNFIDERAFLELHNDFHQERVSVRTIVPFGNPQSHMFEVRLEVNPEIWTVGESVRLSMPTAVEEEVLTVPRDALILRREGTSVFKVNADMTVEQVSVITGLGDGSYIEVNGELDPGDPVVTRGAERLSTGMMVTLIP